MEVSLYFVFNCKELTLVESALFWVIDISQDESGNFLFLRESINFFDLVFVSSGSVLASLGSKPLPLFLTIHNFSTVNMEDLS